MHASQPSEFEAELARRTLVSEQRRAQILAWVLSGLAVIAVSYGLVSALRGEPVPGFRWLMLSTSSGCAFEWITSRFLARAVRRGAQPARFHFYLIALVELSVPTLVMLIFATHTHPANAISGPASYAYFLFIILSALRLDFRLCVFTGAVAAGSYAMLGAIYWPALKAAFIGPPSLLHLSFTMRILLFFIGGLVAGLVSSRIRTTLSETVSALRERERIMSLFGEHVSPAVVNQLLSQPTGLVSELRHVCVLVLDIRNFTTFSEGRVADEVVAYLNTLWSFMVRTVNEHHGIVNKFLGDGFLAVFGAPVSTANDCANALAAARRILREIDVLTEAGRLLPTRIGIALHAGEAVVGNVGSAERKEYTVIGDVVNVAFRIERLNKQLGSTLLVSEAVSQMIPALHFAEVPSSISIRGRQEPVQIYRLS